jgi:hypothetical protein
MYCHGAVVLVTRYA